MASNGRHAILNSGVMLAKSDVISSMLAIEHWPVARLRPYARNARKHPPEQIAQLRQSLREYGFTVPVLVREDGTIIAGHGRIDAAKAEAVTDVPVVIARGWSEEQCRAYTLIDNRLAEQASWDFGVLAEEIEALAGKGVDLAFYGFDDEFMPARGTAGLTDPDEAPEAPAKPVSALGDVWVLGRHRLVCGDCTNAAAVTTALNGVKPHLMVTDPPYGVEYDPDWRNRADRANGKPYGDRAIGQVTNDDRADWRKAYALFPGDVVYVWHPPGARQVEFYNSLMASGFDVRMQIIWAKSHFPIGRGNYHVQHEPCWYAVRKGKTGHWAGDRKQTTLWQIDKPQKSETGHSTQKPVECMKRPIENNSSPGQAVYDPFVGSGTTIIAAEMTGRVCNAIELSPAYVDMSVIRWQNFTGSAAVHEASGATFAEMKALPSSPEPGTVS